MAKQEKPAPKAKEKVKVLIIEKRSIGGNPQAWQPTIDRTTTPPKGDPDTKK